jgi:N-acetylglucosaminyl-diphospho-decaprenol L-rhamnosyltransferase
MHSVSVSIVSHNQLSITNFLLNDLAAQSCASGIEVLLTLNVNSEVFDTDIYPTLTIRIIRNDTPKGFASNHNQAFGHSTAPIFCVLNPDIRLIDPLALERLIAAAKAEDGFVVPEIVDKNGLLEDSIRINLSPWAVARRVILRRRDRGSATQTRLGMPFFWAAGMFLVCKSEIYARLGGFDDRFFMYCEDYDLSSRAYLAGLSLRVVEDVRAIHDAQRSSHRSMKYLRWHIRSLMRVWTSGVFWRVVWSQRRLASLAR